jgi:hypothetical protein
LLTFSNSSPNAHFEQKKQLPKHPLSSILTFSLLLKMVEISASMELKAKSGELVESIDTDFADISFEELLAQEKKDSFWYA